MIWYFVIGVVILFSAYKFITAKTRKAANVVALSLGIKRIFVDEMLKAMGTERGQMFAQTISNWGDKEYHGAYTFVVYQIMKNDSEQNIQWWKSKLRENNIDPAMNHSAAQVAFMYLRDAGADITRIGKFLETYNSIS
ncbi:DUF1198 family protein [Pseudomonas segetis]